MARQSLDAIAEDLELTAGDFRGGLRMPKIYNSYNSVKDQIDDDAKADIYRLIRHMEKVKMSEAQSTIVEANHARPATSGTGRRVETINTSDERALLQAKWKVVNNLKYQLQADERELVIKSQQTKTAHSFGKTRAEHTWSDTENEKITAARVVYKPAPPAAKTDRVVSYGRRARYQPAYRRRHGSKWD